MDDVKNCSDAKFKLISVHVPLVPRGARILRIVPKIAAFEIDTQAPRSFLYAPAP